MENPYVAEGNRRLKALRQLVKDGRIAKDWPTKVEEMAGDVDPLELSLTANIMALPMHEVDQYEAFAKLADAGKSEEDIASSFGTSSLVVKRRLALGSLSPKLRDAWRGDKFGAEVAQAFTIVQDHALQETVYASLAKGQMLYRHSIIRALTRSDVAQDSDLKYVGQDAYLAAGGRLARDLFAEEAHVLDPEILKRLEREKVDAAARDLVAQGWAWAAPRVRPAARPLPMAEGRDDGRAHGRGKRFASDELRPLAEATGAANTAAAFRERSAAQDEGRLIGERAWLRSLTPEHKAASGCMLHVGRDGELTVRYGVVRPGEDLAGPVPVGAVANGLLAEEPDAAGAEPSGPEISGALSQTLSEQLTAAAAIALVDEPDLALRVLVAGLQSYNSPARVRGDGWRGLDGALSLPIVSRSGDFAGNFERALGTSMAHLRVEVAQRVARSLDLTDAAAAHPAAAVKGQRELVDALDAQGYLKAARQAFDAAAYFDRAPAAVAIAAIEEMGGEKPTGKKGVIALAAATLAERLGWLPPVMRSRHYVPPRVSGPADKTTENRARGRRKAPTAAAPVPN